MKNMMKLKEVVNINKLFTHFQNVPWLEDVDSNSLNLLYSARSANKYIAPVLDLFVTQSQPTLSDADLDTIALALESLFLTNWSKLYEAVKSTYDFRDNYDIKTEHSERENTTDSGEVESKNENTVTSSGNGSESSYGFNSDSPVPVDSNSNTQSTGVIEDKNQISNSIRDTSLTSDTRKHGNIGVMIYPQMLKSEIDVRRWEYFERVFSDIDSMLTLSVY